MAKQPKDQPKPKSAPKPEPLKIKTHTAYRVEKYGQFEYQAFKLELKDDGSFIESKFGNVTLFNLVMRRIYEAQGAEAHQVYMKNKTIEEESRKEAEKSP